MAPVRLGRGEVQVKNGNLLLNCFSPNHGWLWTDGQSVFLHPCRDDGVIEESSKASKKLGDYGKVIKVSWSTAVEGQCQCFLAVQEPESVTIWEVTGRSTNQQFTVQKKFDGMKQINDVIWHPLLPIVCILSSSGAVVFSLNPDWSVNLSSSYLTTGCWTLDGKILVLAESRLLKIYLWDDICNNQDRWKEQHMTFDRFQGKLRSLVGLSSKEIIATTDLPLVQIIHQSNQDMFEPLVINKDTSTYRSLITELSETSYDSVTMTTKEEIDVSVGKVESVTAECSMDLKETLKEEIMKRGKGPVDLTAMMTVFSETKKMGKKQENIENGKSGAPENLLETGTKQSDDGADVCNSRLLKNNSSSASGSLLGPSSLFLNDTFVKKEELSGTKRGWNAVVEGKPENISAIPVFKQIEKPEVEETANVHLIDLSPEEPAILDSCQIPGLITPDLMTLQHQSSDLLVGSRNSEIIHRFEVGDSTIRKLSKPVHLSNQERPVGIQCGPHRDVLSVLVSKPVTLSLQNVFPSSSNTDQVELYLRQLNLDLPLTQWIADEEDATWATSADASDLKICRDITLSMSQAFVKCIHSDREIRLRQYRGTLLEEIIVIFTVFIEKSGSSSTEASCLKRQLRYLPFP